VSEEAALGPADERPRLWSNPAFRTAGVGWVLIAVSLALEPGAPKAALLAGAILLAGFRFAGDGLRQLTQGVVGIDLLMTVAVAAAAAIGRWQEAAYVAGLFAVSEALEGHTLRRTRYAIRGLMDRVPATAQVVRDGVEVETPVGQVAVGEILRVRPGDAVPLDGVVLEGASEVDESTITGESLPVDRAPGDRLYASTLNGRGSMLMRVEHAQQDTTVRKIVELVEKAQAHKARTQTWVERFGRIYAPCVLLGSVLVAVAFVLLGATWTEALERAVAVLVAASPCALAAAAPVTVAAAIGGAARRGMLIKGGTVLDALARVRAVAFDKTGTLTTGAPSLAAILTLAGTEEQLLLRAAAVEQLSEHPLARAIVAAARVRKLSLPQVTDFQSLTSVGVEAYLEGFTIRVVKPAAVLAQGSELSAEARTWCQVQEALGRTVVVVLRDRSPQGLIALADTLRPSAKGLSEALAALGVRETAMLTGDNERAARSVSQAMGIGTVHAGLLPAQKIEQVRALAARAGPVLMLGDGVNDAPALAAASVGMAMGTAGSDAALASADVALIGDDLRLVPAAIRLGRRSVRLMRQGITLSLLIVLGLVVGVFTSQVDMLGAVLVHEGSEVLVILNGLRAGLR